MPFGGYLRGIEIVLPGEVFTFRISALCHKPIFFNESRFVGTHLSKVDPTMTT